MKKKKQNQYEFLTKTPVSKLVIKLGIPTTISMLVTNIYNLVDTAFVGKFGNSATGAVGIVFGFMAILQAFGFMFGQGAGSIISRLLGNRNKKEASITASTAVFFAFISGIIIGILSFIFMEKLIMLLGSTSTILPFAKSYIRFLIFVSPLVVSSFVLNNILRYEGRANFAMIGLLSGAILNCTLDPLLMFTFKMGVAGAGLSTAISQSVSFFILLYVFLSGRTASKLSFKNIRFDFKRILNICETGFPSLIRQGLNSLSTILLNSSAAIYGDAAVAAMSIVSRVTMFVFSVGLGIGQGYQPVCAFNFGAKNYTRNRKAFKFTLIFSEILLGIIALVVIIFAEPVVSIFRNDPSVIEIAKRALILQCIALYFLPFTVVTEMTLQSTGKKLSASVVSALKSGIIFIPVLLLLSKVRGLSGIEESQAISYVISFFISIPFAVTFFKHLPKETENNTEAKE